MNAPTTRVVVTDANVLINFMHVGRLSLCAELPNLEFVVPDHVRHLGRGEAACLVLAEKNGWTVASDEKGRFRREAVARIGLYQGKKDLQ